MRELFTILTLLTLFSCDKSKSHDGDKLAADTVAVSDNSDRRKKNCEALFRVDDTFTIQNVKKSTDKQSSSADAAMCNKWTLTLNDVERIIKDCEVISGPDWHHLFDHLPCSVSGQLGQRGNTFDFEINAGSWLTVTCGDSTVRLGNFRKDNEHLFLSTAIESEIVQ